MRPFKIHILLAILLAGFGLNAASAATDAINYQTVVRDSDGEPIINEEVELRFKVRSGSATGSLVYEETHEPTTNEQGLINVKIGRGTAITGDFSDIEWAEEEQHLEVNLDGESMGTQELVNVPYAIVSDHATTAETAEELTNMPSLTNLNDVNAESPDDEQVLKWDGSQWVPKEDEDTEYTAGDGLDLSGNEFSAENNSAIWNANRLKGNNIDSDNPSSGDVLQWDGSEWSNSNLEPSKWSQSGSDIYFDNGNVGIGTNDPHSRLGVEGNIHSTEDIEANGQIRIDADSTNNFSYIRFKNQVGPNGPRLYHSESGGANAFWFSGIDEVIVREDLSVFGAKNFKIDHPEDPENKYLYHSAIEGDERYNKYSGNITTDEEGEAVVELPSYVEAVNRDFRYNLTVVGEFAQAIVGEEVADGEFLIKTDEPEVKLGIDGCTR